MCLFTHFAAGALAGGATGNPALGLLTGIASHAVLDAIPHYDHPDWRLELAGGVLSLVFLMMMPFATLPAILGGLGGMLPDLENLFQKLGKMRRDQFIFPSHTGLIPHGKTLGPRTLVWQVAIFAVCFGILSFISPGSAFAAEIQQKAVMGHPVVNVLSSNQDNTRLQLSFPVESQPADWEALNQNQIIWALPTSLDEEAGRDPIVMPPQMGFSLAVPTLDKLQVQVSGVTWWKEPSSRVGTHDLVDLGQQAIMRSVPVAGAMVPLGVADGVLRSLTIEISHPAQGKPREQLRLARDFKASGAYDSWAEPVPQGLLNGPLFSALARGGRQMAISRTAEEKAAARGQYNHFDLTSNWVRLEVSQAGIHQITGQELSEMGVPAADVDPASLRLFQGGGVHLDNDPEVEESAQAASVGLTEMAIQVLAGTDGEWNLDDELRFYGFPSSIWKDRLDPVARPLDFYDHPMENHGIYWLTWQSTGETSSLPGSPLRMETRLAAATGGEVVTTALLRVHEEEQNVDSPGWSDDNWTWDGSVYSTRSGNFTVRNPVAGSQAQFVIDFKGRPISGTPSNYIYIADGWLNSDTANLATTTYFRNHEVDSLRVRVVGTSDSLVNGINQFTLRNSGGGSRPPLALDAFELMYEADLDVRGLIQPFEFIHWTHEVDTPGQNFDFQLDVQDVNRTVVWDVTDPVAPLLLNPDLDGGPPAVLTIGVSRELGSSLHMLAQDQNYLLDVASGIKISPPALRDEDTDVDYIVVYAGPFQQAAERLADYHDQELVGISNPRAIAVSAEDIYNNFSGGRKDAMAIRNYLKFVFEDSHRLRYVCLLGNASRDYRNYRGHTPFVDLVDFIPSQLRTTFPVVVVGNSLNLPYSSDDALTSFNSPPSAGDLDYPDLASGRLPATTVEEANSMVDIMINYGGQPAEGMWRNRVLVTSDDCNRPSHYPYPLVSEISHLNRAESLSEFYFPGSLDLNKIYGVEYDFPPGSLVKPQCRADINSALNDGTSIYYYVGHGAEDNLADEQIFQSRDINNLNNGLRRPLFVAFSCDVGVFDNPIRRSMAELFVASENGGAIGSICASQVSYISYNNILSADFFANMYPEQEVVDDQTISWSLLQAKASASGPSGRKNSQRYTLFCDPGLRLPNPVSNLEFASTTLDTLRAGARQVVTANVGAGAKALLGAGDSYDLRVEESAYDKVFTVYTYSTDYNQDPPQIVYTPHERDFNKLGATVFRGTGTLDSDDLRVPFKVPSQLRYGDQASIRLLVGNSDEEYTVETPVSAVRSSTSGVDDLQGPQIGLSLPNRYRVRPGDVLTAAFTDTSGIAILGTSPGNSILLEFDNTGFMTEVTESFSYDPNSYTTGRMLFPLPSDISTGKHSVAVHASDALGNVGSDTLRFTVAEYGVTGIKDVTVFPNPTPGPCRLIFDLTDGMDITWEIYTLSGLRVKEITDSFGSPGPGILEWDGRDEQGDEIANGTYLYVLRGNWAGNDGHELKETGKLVIMR